MFENTPDAYCPVCGVRVPADCLKFSESSGDSVTELYTCPGCGCRFCVETSVLTEVS